ncbi:hypothetical protein [Thermasporomyces composti]|jgi:hypothetical protein|uniref:Transmembrane protein n=1 Tax=Thermasporomyces composti TaxID=696763 RepID=A0A3D9V7E9_THECX|nr:hypothetical protein [Thermasporomyces composti]REF37236.1 hypothetical protein DFJ64_2677 [Thermasporomyces composti]
MNDAAAALATATTFVWLGMVLAISFMEAPLKFRAPGITLRLGLGIGRIVFRALNTAEIALALLLLIGVALGDVSGVTTALTAAVVGLLAVQLLGVRPPLNRRSDRVLAGEDHLPRSRMHHVYVALESVKVLVLVALGISLFAT